MPLEEDVFLILYILAGAVEPNAQGCAFAHPIFHPQARKGQVLRTKILISIK